MVPPPGVSSISIVAPIAVEEAVGDGEAEPDAAGVGVAEALERLEHTLAVGRSDAATAVDDAQIDVAVALAGLDADALPSGLKRTALSTTLAIARSSRAGSASTGRKRLGHVDVDDRAGAARC